MTTYELPVPEIPVVIEFVDSPGSINTVERLKFKLKVKNDGPETITLVRDPSGVLSSRYRTAKFIVGSPSFVDAQPVFKGDDIKWSPTKAAELGDTIVIGPGKTADHVIDQDLSRTYDFTGPGPGVYTFTPRKYFYIVDPVSREVVLVKAASVPRVEVTIRGTLVIVDADPPDQAKKPVTKFQDIEIIGGTSEQHIQVMSAIRSAQDYIVRCNRYFEIAPTATSHYETWFGPHGIHAQSLVDTVKRVYSIIDGRAMRVRYDLTTCADDSIFAKVTSDETIALCSLFWEARLTGVDSQAGTILHELTHLPYKDSVDSTIHKGTWDWGYGVVNCKMLASVAWTTAVKNADSFEYFAELMDSKIASGLFFSGKDGFNGTFAIPKIPSPFIFTGRFNVAPSPPFSSANVALIYDDVKDLTGSYAVQAGSTAQLKKINLRLKNEAGKELIVFANLDEDFYTEYQVAGNGSWNSGGK